MQVHPLDNMCGGGGGGGVGLEPLAEREMLVNCNIKSILNIPSIDLCKLCNSC